MGIINMYKLLIWILLLFIIGCSNESLLQDAQNELSVNSGAIVVDSMAVSSTIVTNDSSHVKIQCKLLSKFSYTVSIDMSNVGLGVSNFNRVTVGNDIVDEIDIIVNNNISSGEKQFPIVVSNIKGSVFKTNVSLTIVAAMPEIRSPAEGSVIRTLTPAITWLMPQSATGCRLQISSQSDFSILTEDRSLGIVTNCLIGSTLNNDAFYYLRLKTYDTNGESSFSQVRTIFVYTNDDFYVSSSGDDSNPGSFTYPKRTIQDALNSCDQYSNLILKISEGVYTASSGHSSCISISNDVVLKGGYYNNFANNDPIGHPSILNGQNSVSHVVSIFGGKFVSLDSLVIQGGTALEYGGGVRIHPNEDMSFKHILFTNSIICSNAAGKTGGGVYIDNRFSDVIGVSFINCELKYNSSGINGGGVGLQGYFSGTNVIYILDSLFHHNQADGTGGGFCAWNGNIVVISNSVFRDNFLVNGTYKYGGAAIFLGDLTSAIVASNLIMNNDANAGSGGALAISLFSAVEIDNNYFKLNDSNFIASKGMYIYLSSPVIKNCVFSTPSGIAIRDAMPSFYNNVFTDIIFSHDISSFTPTEVATNQFTGSIDFFGITSISGINNESWAHDNF